MRNKIFTIAFILVFSVFYTQCKKANLLIMIDEKPSLTISDFYISSQSEEKIKAKYTVGGIDLNDETYTKLLNNQSQNLNLNFEAILPNKTFATKYVIEIPKSFFSQDYLIVNIFNLDNKKYKNKYSNLIKDNKKYYVVIETPSSMKFN
ncbi:hypothetical protein EGI16_00015 [Chryseobacterium sp. G0240]|nr:hypothetical protein EGI16_00015 [Chryseobacterium sp. G0240]